MKKNTIKYWLEELDRFGLILCGILIGGLLELTGLNYSSILISITGIIVLIIISKVLENKINKNEKNKRNTSRN